MNNLYNIARESVNNAIKHGMADWIELSLSEDDEHIYLSIKDKGRGATEGFEEKKGIGLRIMRYRAGIIGGSVALKSAKNGFEVFVSIKKEFLAKYLQ